MLVIVEHMFMLILLLLLGGVTEDAPPFPGGVVTDECDNQRMSPSLELPGPLSWGA